ncbi:MAG: hypothetical protein BWY09_02831 [Candidatus Hydrogenedentes bacterium ADurb.Bin179]|nr:MAG: hypothetical protein BWY09_02831 [Candidatus Hydrogenedentes bacterium ADurb.Bin179]
MLLKSARRVGNTVGANFLGVVTVQNDSGFYTGFHHKRLNAKRPLADVLYCAVQRGDHTGYATTRYTVRLYANTLK